MMVREARALVTEGGGEGWIVSDALWGKECWVGRREGVRRGISWSLPVHCRIPCIGFVLPHCGKQANSQQFVKDEQRMRGGRA